METMQPTEKLGRNVWDPINMPKSEFEARVKKMRKGMKEKGMDLLLVYGNGLNEYGNPCYISNMHIRLGQRGVLAAIPKKDDVVLIFEGALRGLPSVKATTWMEEIRACGDISKECVKYIKEKNLIPSKIGFAGLRDLMPHYQFRFLSESLNQCKIVDADNLIKEMRMVKSQKECDEIRRASRIIGQLFEFIANTPISGLNERKLEAKVIREARFAAAEDVRMLIAKPKEAKWAFRPAEDVPTSSGDTMIILLAVEYERYWSEGIRTFVVEDSSLVEVKSENLQSLYDRIMGGLLPGKKASQYDKETIREIRKSKVDDIQEYGLGQGIGLGFQEFPVIAEKDGTLLKEGMCLTLRLGIKDKEKGALFAANTIYLSKNGPEVLTR